LYIAEILEVAWDMVRDWGMKLNNDDILDNVDAKVNDDEIDSYNVPSLDDSWDIASDWDNDCNRDWILEVDWNSVR